MIEMPPALDAAWHTHGYYGSVSHNVKAIYQRYLGWYDGNPAHLWQHPPRSSGDTLRHGSSAASTPPSPRPASSSTRAICGSPPSWPATPCSPTPTQPTPQTVLADALQPLGYGSENATWRNCFLTGADELRERHQAHRHLSVGRAWPRAMTVTQLFDTIAIRIDGPRAADAHVRVLWHFTDADERLPHGAVQRRAHPPPDQPHTSTPT